jgi:prepilin-type N-terminal cleavage/methylation domain-containing protein
MHEPNTTRRDGARRALTLVELLVVLTILAIMASVAVTSTQVVLDQGRFEATQRTMQGIEDAVLGQDYLRQPGGTATITGFVADLGRPPRVVGSDATFQLAELWNNDKDDNGSVDLPAFGFAQAPSDPEILVPRGWKGPYLRLPAGTGILKDGWGFALVPEFGGPALDLLRVSSLGADNSVGGADYDQDMTVDLPSTRYASTVTGTVYRLDASTCEHLAPSDPAAVTVILYGPDPEMIPGNATNGVAETSATMTYNNEADEVNYVNYAVTSTFGPRIIRAYMNSQKSQPIHLMLLPGAQSVDIRIE